jgi:hypothetical protein
MTVQSHASAIRGIPLGQLILSQLLRDLTRCTDTFFIVLSYNVYIMSEDSFCLCLEAIRTGQSDAEEDIKMPIYSFRAEYQADVDQLRQALTTDGISSSMQITRPDQLPDVQVELETPAKLETIRNIMRGMEDGHVMVETLRACPLAKNSLERHYEA